MGLTKFRASSFFELIDESGDILFSIDPLAAQASTFPESKQAGKSPPSDMSVLLRIATGEPRSLHFLRIENGVANKVFLRAGLYAQRAYIKGFRLKQVSAPTVDLSFGTHDGLRILDGAIRILNLADCEIVEGHISQKKEPIVINISRSRLSNCTITLTGKAASSQIIGLETAALSNVRIEIGGRTKYFPKLDLKIN